MIEATESDAVDSYGFGLLFESQPILDVDAVVARLQRDDRVDLVSKSDEVSQLAYPDHEVSVGGRRLPTFINIVRWSRPIGPADFASALEQTFNWSQAEEMVARCRHKLLVTDLMAATLSYKERFKLITRVVTAVVELTRPTAIHWEAADSIVEPASLERRLSFYCNVRAYAITNVKGNKLMDTKGLAELGLVDAQCLYRQLDASEVAWWLFLLGRQIFDKGDFIKDGEALPGIDPAQRWLCHHQLSMTPPPRMVIDITPPKPHAGKR